MERLIGSIQDYAWGDTFTLADLQGRDPSGQPEAELWMGAHAMGPSRLLDSDRSLAEAVEADPDGLLGPGVLARFGRFPYLLKVLAAARPLSIQVHPSLAQAEQGFAREEASGDPWNSPTRSYRDNNHKPELICALTPFEAKCGFREPEQTLLLLEALQAVAPAPALAGLCRELDNGSDSAGCVRRALESILRLDDAEVPGIVQAVLRAGERLIAGGELPDSLARFGPDLAWLPELNRHYPDDVGVVVSLLLNHQTLHPGQAMFLGAGNMHSYLRGAGIEVMANSDNVIRGGLTNKHIDVDELLRVVDTRPSAAPVQTPVGDRYRFEAEVPDFSLTRMTAGPATEMTPVGPEIVLVTTGRVAVSSAATGRSIELGRGEAGFVGWSDGPYRLSPESGAIVWRAGAGDLSLPS